MTWRELAIQDIKSAEGCRYSAYQDKGGVWTCGYGHTGPDVDQSTTCTPWQAEFWISADLSEAERNLDIWTPWWTQAPNPVRRGLLNMCFNLGWPRLAGFKKMLEAGGNSCWGWMADEALASKWASQVGGRATHIAGLFRSAETGATV